MDYQVDSSKIALPWAKIIVINAVITIVISIAFNLFLPYVLPSSVFVRLKEVERKSAETEVNFEKLFGKIKIGN